MQKNLKCFQKNTYYPISVECPDLSTSKTASWSGARSILPGARSSGCKARRACRKIQRQRHRRASSGTRARSPAGRVICPNGWPIPRAMCSAGESCKSKSNSQSRRSTIRICGASQPINQSDSKDNGTTRKRGCTTTGSGIMIRMLGGSFTKTRLGCWAGLTFINMRLIQWHGLTRWDWRSQGNGKELEMVEFALILLMYKIQINRLMHTVNAPLERKKS